MSTKDIGTIIEKMSLGKKYRQINILQSKLTVIQRPNLKINKNIYTYLLDNSME